MAGNKLNTKVYKPLKQRVGLTGNSHTNCHNLYNLPLQPPTVLS